MQLKDIANMEKYLQEDCYCPGEIYDRSGFFAMIFKPEEECTILVEDGTKDENAATTVTSVVCRKQVINFWIDKNNGEIVSAERYDATDNNIREIMDYWNNKNDQVSLNEFQEGETTKSLAEIMKYTDTIMVS